MKSKQGKVGVVTNQNSNVRREGPEQWWAGIPSDQKLFMYQIATCLGEVTDTKRLELRRAQGALRARFIHILKRPEPGCVSAIVVPEVPAGWN